MAVDYLPNGHWTYIYDDQAVRYTCHNGFSLTGHATRWRKADGAWTGNMPNCVPGESSFNENVCILTLYLSIYELQFIRLQLSKTNAVLQLPNGIRKIVDSVQSLKLLFHFIIAW